MAIKKVLLTKKLNNVVYEIFPKTSAEIVVYGETTVAAALAEFATGLANVYTKGETDSAIEASATNLYNKIMGITAEDGATVTEAYDTLKEVAAWIDEHGEIAAGFTNDIAALKTAVGDENSGLVKAMADAQAAIEANDGDIAGLQAAVEAMDTAYKAADAALQASVTALEGRATALEGRATALEGRADALEATVGDANSGLVKQVADLIAADGSHVEDSETNGNIVVDGEEVVVYTHPETHAASMIVEEDDRKFVTSAEKDIINNAAAVVFVASADEVANERDLYMVEIQ